MISGYYIAVEIDNIIDYPIERVSEVELHSVFDDVVHLRRHVVARILHLERRLEIYVRRRAVVLGRERLERGSDRVGLGAGLGNRERAVGIARDRVVFGLRLVEFRIGDDAVFALHIAENSRDLIEFGRDEQ